MRVACFTPLPPARSGIADHSAILLPLLAKRCDLDVWVDSQAHPLVDCAGLRIRDARRERVEPLLDEYDAVVYQIGNHAGFHGLFYDLALRHPGIAVMHDWVLHHMIRTHYAGGERYQRELRYEFGGNFRAGDGGRERSWETAHPLNQRLLDRSLGVVVHSMYARDLVRQHCAVPVGFVPLFIVPRSINPETGRRARARFGLPDDRVVVGVFGFINDPNRRLREILAVLRDTRLRHPVHLLVVGEWAREDQLELMRDFPYPDRVTATGYVADGDFDAYISAVDAILSLRHPTMGESSAGLTRALGFGKVSAVTAGGSYAEYPDQVAIKVKPEREHEDLLDFLNTLRPTGCRPTPEVLDFVAGYPTPLDIASELLRFIEAVVNLKAQMMFLGRMADVFHGLGLTSTDGGLLNQLSGIMRGPGLWGAL